MRPSPDLVVSRAIGRAVSVTVGALAAALAAQWSPPEAIHSVVLLLVIGAASAMRGSRWYVTPGFTTFLVLSLILHGPRESSVARFDERLTDTLLGVGLALIFGWAIPTARARLRVR